MATETRKRYAYIPKGRRVRFDGTCSLLAEPGVMVGECQASLGGFVSIALDDGRSAYVPLGDVLEVLPCR